MEVRVVTDRRKYAEQPSKHGYHFRGGGGGCSRLVWLGRRSREWGLSRDGGGDAISLNCLLSPPPPSSLCLPPSLSPSLFSFRSIFLPSKCGAANRLFPSPVSRREMIARNKRQTFFARFLLEEDQARFCPEVPRRQLLHIPATIL